MQTRFDDLTDTQIDHAVSLTTLDQRYDDILSEEDLRRIAYLAAVMHHMRAWVGFPVTFFQQHGLEFDGHHRVRATKYLARRHGLQIQIPVRYAPAMKE